MKTSNKLLLGAFLLGLLFTLSAMMYAKSNMTITMRETTEGDGTIVTREIMSEYVSSQLSLDGHYIYTLDPSSTGISVKADKNLIDVYQVSDEEKLSFYREGTLSINPSKKVEFIIGISGKEDIEIYASDVSRVYSNDVISDDLTINTEDAAKVELTVNCDNLEVDSKDASKVNISGTCNSITADIEDNSRLNVEDIRLENLMLDLEDTGRYKGKSASNVIIKLEDNSRVTLDEKWQSGTHKIRDLGTIRIGEKEVLTADSKN